MGLAQDQMLMGLAHELMLIGLALEHMLMEPDPGPNELKSRSGQHIRISGPGVAKSEILSKSLEIDEYGTSRPENSSKSIYKQFPIDWRPSQTPKPK